MRLQLILLAIFFFSCDGRKSKDAGNQTRKVYFQYFDYAKPEKDILEKYYIPNQQAISYVDFEFGNIKVERIRSPYRDAPDDFLISGVVLNNGYFSDIYTQVLLNGASFPEPSGLVFNDGSSHPVFADQPSDVWDTIPAMSKKEVSILIEDRNFNYKKESKRVKYLHCRMHYFLKRPRMLNGQIVSQFNDGHRLIIDFEELMKRVK